LVQLRVCRDLLNARQGIGVAVGVGVAVSSGSLSRSTECSSGH